MNATLNEHSHEHDPTAQSNSSGFSRKKYTTLYTRVFTELKRSHEHMNMIFEWKFRGSCVVATSRKTATNKQTNKQTTTTQTE